MPHDILFLSQENSYYTKIKLRGSFNSVKETFKVRRIYLGINLHDIMGVVVQFILLIGGSQSSR